MKRLLAVMLLASCSAEVVDPCVGQSGACVGVHLRTQVAPLDQIRVTLDGGASMLTPIRAGAPLPFPVRFAVALSGNATHAHLAFDGLSGGERKATVTTDVQLGTSHHALVDLTLASLAGGADLSVSSAADLGRADLASTDFAGAAPVTLTLSTATLSSGGGSVSVLPVGTPDCGANCLSYPAGTMVTITASPLPSSTHIGWAGVSGCKAALPCAVTLTADTGVIAVFSAAAVNHVFVTSKAYSVAQLGANAANADSICQGHAMMAGLPGTYHAFLALSSTPAVNKFASSRGWVRSDGLPFGDTMASLASGAVFYPITFDETGAPSSQKVWTGTTNTGANGPNCADWNATTGGSYGNFGYAVDGSTNWLAYDMQGCDQSAALYCFTTGPNLQLTIDPPTARRAFVTTMPWTPNGISAADGQCAMEANSNGLGTSFKAYLNGPLTPALGRFDLTRTLWMRLDRVLLAPATRTTQLENGGLAPLIMGAGGNYMSPTHSGWVGTSTLNCSDWVSSVAGQMGTVASITRDDSSSSAVNCAYQNGALFCLEQ